MPENFTEEFVEVGGSKVQLRKGGSGDPLLVLHGAGGSGGWLRYLEALSERFTVYLPSHPGYDESERPEWLENMHDLACFYNWFVESQGIQGCRAMGFSMGGWLASEMVAAAGPVFSKLMLVAPWASSPTTGRSPTCSSSPPPRSLTCCSTTRPSRPNTTRYSARLPPRR